MRVSKLFSALSVVVLVATNALCMLKNIKDTYQILNDDYKHLSICNGAIAWETGFIRRLYDFGQVFYTTTKDKNSLDVIDKYVNPELTHKTVRLIHILFYRVPGSTGITDIGVTQKLNLKKTSEIAQKCAEILASIEQVKMFDKTFQDAVVLFQNELAANKDESKTKNTRSLLVSFVNQPWQEQVGTKINRTLVQKSKSEELFKTVKKAASDLTHELVKSESKFKELIDPIALKKADIRDVVLGSLRECDQSNEKVLYIPHTTEMILLAFVYKTCSEEISALAKFYKALNDLLGGRILNKGAGEVLKQQHVAITETFFQPITSVKALEKIKKILDEDPVNLAIQIDKYFEELIYLLEQVRSTLPLSYYSIANYIFPDGSAVSFSNCMDNAIKNFITQLSYDPKANVLATYQLKKRLGLPESHVLNKSLEEFIKKYADPSSINSSKSHSDWVEVTSNIPFVVYKQRTKKSSFPIGRGFMQIPLEKIPQDLYKLLALKFYERMENESYGYEIRALLYNVIIVLNSLLNLELFESADDCAQQIAQSNFLDTYLPKLAEKIKAEFYVSKKIHSAEGEIKSGIDALDFGDEIYTTFVIEETHFEFMTRLGHGSLVSYNLESNSEQELLKILRTSFVIKNSSTPLGLLINKFLSKNEFIIEGFVKQAPEVVYGNFFVMPLEDSDMFSNYVELLCNATERPDFFNASQTLFFRLAKKQPDRREQERLKFKIYELLYIPKSYDKAIELALEGLSDKQNYYSQVFALVLLRTLVKKDEAYDKAEYAAEEAFNSSNIDVRGQAFQLFQELIKRNRASDKVTALIQSILTNQDTTKWYNALALLAELIKQKKAYSTAIQIASEFAKSSDPQKQGYAVAIFQTLYDQGEGFFDAINIAKEILLKKDDRYHDFGIHLLRSVIRSSKNLNNQEIVSQIKDLINDVMQQPGFNISRKSKLKEILTMI